MRNVHHEDTKDTKKEVILLDRHPRERACEIIQWRGHLAPCAGDAGIWQNTSRSAALRRTQARCLCHFFQIFHTLASGDPDHRLESRVRGNDGMDQPLLCGLRVFVVNKLL
jgi:hypothetical protein